ncbi:hypothetical protein MKW94_027823 [Papaver nudicaule]|uniref:Uncharacterized protein n=1 Tax=Papaver nudicaule TaxID=74823 RepID=A0AA41VV30_PAPNU|nr:hypothetical protein [Papaver nudicaule]
MELDQEVPGEAFVCSRDMPSTQLVPESTPLFAKGISLILYRWLKLRVLVARSRKVPDREIAEYLRLTSSKFKHPLVEKIAADILDLFIRHKEPFCVDSVGTRLNEIVRTYITYSVKLQGVLQVAEKLCNLYQEFLQGKYDSVEELGQTSSWIEEEDVMENLRKAEEQGLISDHTLNASRGKIQRRRRQKYRAYFL